MKIITVSAPGKLMLFGEHAVVYDRPCIMTAVGQRMQAKVELIAEKVLLLDAVDVKVIGYKKPINELGVSEIPKGAQFVEIAVRNFLEKYPLDKGIKVVTKSEFSALFGFGSSSASTVCILKALSQLSGVKLGNRQLFDLAYKTVLDIQGKGSGFDVDAAIYGGTSYFVCGGRYRESIGQNISKMPLVIGYTGVKADTVTLMEQVAKKKTANNEAVERIFAAITKIVEEAKIKIKENDWQRVGKLMDFNQEYLLRDLGVSSEKLESLISAAKRAGAYGAKLSGAGGGDCMIALHPNGIQGKLRVEEAITKAGGQVIDIETNAEGVRIENN